MVRDGAIFTRSSKSRMLARSMLAVVMTNTELGTDWTFSARLVPVTITSSSAGGPLGAGPAATREGGGGGGEVSEAGGGSVATPAVLTWKAAAEAVRPKLSGVRTSAPLSRRRRRI